MMILTQPLDFRGKLFQYNKTHTQKDDVNVFCLAKLPKKIQY